MKHFIFVLLTVCSLQVAFGQNKQLLISEADRLEAIPNEKAALNKFKEALQSDPNNSYALSKASELCSRIGSRTQEAAYQKQWFSAALSYASKGLKVAPSDDRVHVSMAMILGKSSMNQSNREKVRLARDVKKHLDLAIKLNPGNYLAWHILGRLNYEISNVSSVERAAAKVLYGGMPEGSVTNAIRFLEKARSIQPKFILNNIELAKAYHKNGNTTHALDLLKAVASLPVNTEDDPWLKTIAVKLINEFS